MPIPNFNTAYVTNNGNGWYIESPEGSLRGDGSLRHYAWDGHHWSLTTAWYFRRKEDAQARLYDLSITTLKPAMDFFTSPKDSTMLEEARQMAAEEGEYDANY